MRNELEAELDDLARREAFAREMGGVDKVSGNATGPAHRPRAHDRLRRCKNLHEVGAISGVGDTIRRANSTKLTPANACSAAAQIDGRTVVVVG